MALIIPKNNADAQTLDATLKIYYDVQDWVENEDLIDRLSQSLIALGIENEKKEPQSYTKKTQVLAYFGFITWEDLENSQSRRKITSLGISFYEARLANDNMRVIDVLIKSLASQTFGRNVIGCDSDSDIEAPNVFIKASLLLNGLNNKQFAFILGEMELGNKSFEDALLQLKLSGYSNISSEIREDAKKWADPKPITALKNWGLIDSSTGCIPRDIIDKYGGQLLSLRTKNNEAIRFKGVSENENSEQEFRQKIYYGSPGTGKSHEVKKITGEIEAEKEGKELPNVFRTTFHPDTDYATFVGCYKPTMKDTGQIRKVGDKTEKVEEISYEFVPQTFTDAYVYAYKNPSTTTYLVIEEINRGNCAQIFGDLFQLLDRKEGGISVYRIKADKDLARYLVNEGVVSGEAKDVKLCLPANLHILATMNTSDQSLFPMDSAFKRRWDWEYVPISYDEPKSSAFEIEIGGEKYSWVKFIEAVNKRILALTDSEDKMMGNFFIKSSVDERQFKSKVMFYLWNEVLRDEVGNQKYFFYWRDKNNADHDFMFNEIYGDNANDIMKGFMAYIFDKKLNQKSENTVEE